MFLEFSISPFNMRPEKSTRFLEKSTLFPEKSTLPPEKSTWFPEKSTLFLEKMIWWVIVIQTNKF